MLLVQQWFFGDIVLKIGGNYCCVFGDIFLGGFGDMWCDNYVIEFDDKRMIVLQWFVVIDIQCCVVQWVVVQGINQCCFVDYCCVRGIDQQCVGFYIV